MASFSVIKQEIALPKTNVSAGGELQGPICNGSSVITDLLMDSVSMPIYVQIHEEANEKQLIKP